MIRYSHAMPFQCSLLTEPWIRPPTLSPNNIFRTRANYTAHCKTNLSKAVGDPEQHANNYPKALLTTL